MLTVTGKLAYGLEIDGVRHFDFEMRLPTMEDVERAIEETPESARYARIKRHVWARCLIRLGSLTKVTPEMLAGLQADEFGVFEVAEGDLKKKLIAGNSAKKTSE